MVQKKLNPPVRDSSVGKNALFKTEVRGERPDWFKVAGGLQKMQITALYNSVK